MISFGSPSIAPTSVLDELRIDLKCAAGPRRRVRQRQLPFVSYPQSRPSWCWAAVAMSVMRYYRPQSKVTQCAIVSRVLGRDCCDDHVDDPACNVQTALTTALQVVGHGRECHDADAALACHLIDQERPVGIFIRWSETRGHFAVLSGYALPASGLQFTVADPRYGARPVSAADLREGRYRGSGRWTKLYPTERRS